MVAARKVEIRRGAYYDSIVLMELQATLMDLPGVRAATHVGLAQPRPKERIRPVRQLRP